MSHTLGGGGEEEEKRKTPVTLKHSNLVTSGHCKVSAHLKCHVRWNGLLINNFHLSVCLSVCLLPCLKRPPGFCTEVEKRASR